MKKKSGILLGTAVLLLFGYGFRMIQDNVAGPLPGYDKANMDLTADPCQDFYQYAVGGWMKNNPIPSTDSRWGSFNILAKQNEEKIKVILEDLTKQADSTLSFNQRLVRDFYYSAIDTIAMDYYGYRPLSSIFGEIESFSNMNELPNLLAGLKTYGVDAIFNLNITADARQSLANAVYISQGGLNLPDVDYYTKTEARDVQIRKDYEVHIQNMLTLVGEKNVKEKSAVILKIETDLAKVSMSRAERRDPDKTYNKMPVDILNAKYPFFLWNQYFGANLINPTRVIVQQPAFFEGLKSIIPTYSIENWKSYFKWCVIHDYAGAMGAGFEAESFRFYSNVLRGVPEMKPMQERAIASVNGNLGEPLGQLFVQKHFSEDSKKRVAEMVEELREVFKERINGLEWMSDSTKVLAKAKLAAFKYKIGFPDVWQDYSSLVVVSNAYLQNIINIRVYNVQRMRAKFNKPVDRNEWSMSPQTVNAYYSSNKNEIVFPAGILQAPFFDPNVEDALNYGGIGAVIGHEFSHGFDDKGSKFDRLGNLNNWWTEEDLKNFEERTGKIVAQFSSYEVLDNVFINGSLTQGENIADLAGLTLAYYALKKHYAKVPPAATSPDGFTWQQRFFLGWSLVWAQNITEKELRNRIITDPHSPGRYRVVGPLSNMPEFWDAFLCKPSDAMVAKKEVQVKLW